MEHGPFVDDLHIKNGGFKQLCWINRGYTSMFHHASPFSMVKSPFINMFDDQIPMFYRLINCGMAVDPPWNRRRAFFPITTLISPLLAPVCGFNPPISQVYQPRLLGRRNISIREHRHTRCGFGVMRAAKGIIRMPRMYAI